MPKAPITIGTIVTFMFHSFFQFSSKVEVLILLFTFLQIYFVVCRDSKVDNFANALFLLLIIIMSGLLAGIRWSVCMLKSHRSLYVSVSRACAGSCILLLLLLLLLCLSWCEYRHVVIFRMFVVMFVSNIIVFVNLAVYLKLLFLIYICCYLFFFCGAGRSFLYTSQISENKMLEWGWSLQSKQEIIKPNQTILFLSFKSWDFVYTDETNRSCYEKWRETRDWRIPGALLRMERLLIYHKAPFGVVDR